MASDRDPAEDGGPGGIKVTDRRAFNRAGERREDVPAAPAPEPARPARTETPAAGARSGSEPAARPREAEPAGKPEPARVVAPDQGPAEPAPSIDFVAFLQSLYVGALMSLGEIESPYTRQFETNLDLAKQNIDILVMLREKTRGNLSDEEEALLEQVVPQLQMLYVRKAG